MKYYRHVAIAALAAAIAFFSCDADAKALRIVSYNIDCADQSSDNNITGATHSLPTVVQAIGLHHIGTNVQQVDVMSCEELQSTTLANFVSALNNIYGAGTYAYDPTVDPNTGGGPDGLIYNTTTVQVISARALPTGQTVLLQSNSAYTAAHSPGGGVNGVARGPMVYRIRPVGYDSNSDFYMYVSHARSTSDDTVGDARYAEAQEVRSDAKYNLPAGAHILYCGDWNLFNGSGENAYKCLTGQVTSDAIDWSDTSSVWANTNQTQAYDPTSKTTPPTTTTWANVAGDNASYLYGDSTSSLTSRIDLQLPNALMYAAYNSQGGVQLAPDTGDPFDSSNFPSSKYPYAYEVFGNNGTTARSSATTSAANHSLDDLASTSPNASTTLSDIQLVGSGSSFTGSDHYPLVSDWVIISSVAPSITTQPVSQTNNEGATITFTVTASGSAPLAFVWKHNNSTLSDGGNVAGSTTSALTISSISQSDAGTYSVVITNVSGSATSSSATLTVLRSLQSIKTVFIIPMENANWSSIKGSSSASYLNNTLLTMGAHAEQYYNPPANHPSLPNYLWMEAGTNFGISADLLPSSAHQNTTNHMVSLLKRAGIPWRSYDEDVCGCNCPLSNTNKYLPRHNPVVYFDDVTDTNNVGSANCIANVRAYTQLASDLSGNQIGRLNWVVPNSCDDMHDSGCGTGNQILNGDLWLSNNLPAILNSAAYTNNGLIVIVWDEGASSSDGPIGCIVLSPLAKAGYSNSIHYTHSSILRTLQQVFNVGPLLNDAANAVDLGDLLNLGAPAQLAVTPVSGLSSTGPQGGAFSPSSQVYTLTNSGSSTLAWTASNTANWLTLSAASGILAPNSSVAVTASINANANSLAAGAYANTISFTNSINGGGNTTRAVSLTVTNNSADPAITSQPASATFVEGAMGTLSVTATGTQPINYQWQKNNGVGTYTNITGATASSYSKTVVSSDAGSYRVIVTNTVGSATSSIATVTTSTLSTNGIRLSTLSSFTYTQNFDSLPTSSTGYTWTNNSTILGWYADKAGGTTGNSLSTVDNGSSTVNGLHDYGATSSPDRSLGATADSGGSYASNIAFGLRFVNDTPVAVNKMTVVFTGKQWRQTTNNNTLQFTYRATASPATTIDASNNFSWTAASSLNFASLHTGTAGALDGTLAANQSLNSNVVSGINLTAAQELWVRWYLPSQYPCPGLAVDNLSISFGLAPYMTSQPSSQTSGSGQQITFLAAAAGSVSLVYQWQKGATPLSNGGAISGANTANLTISSVSASDSSSYSVVVTNAFGSVTSSVAILTVVDPPMITESPQSITAMQGNSVGFSAIATGSGVSYQWMFNNVAIAGATSNMFVRANAQLTDAGSYSVVASNLAGTVTSSNAVLAVMTSPLHLINITPNVDGSVTTIWNVDAGKSYTLQYQDSLLDVTWTDITNVTSVATTLTVADLNAGSTTNPQRFYQLSSPSDQRASDIAGFINLSLLGSSDNFISLPFVRPSASLQLVSSVTGSNIVVAGLPGWTPNQFVYSSGTQSNTYYVRFTSGGAEGRIYPVSANDTNAISLDLGTDNLNAVAQNDQFSVEPYWTFATVFPNGTGVNVSPTVGNRYTEILTPDLTSSGINLSATKVYFFNASIWKQVGQGSVNHNDDSIQPDSYMVVRHNVSTNTTVFAGGVVISSKLGFPLRVQSDVRQDNAIGLIRPLAVSLDASGLIESGAFQSSPLPGSRTDELLTFDNTVASRNKSAAAIYYYWSNAWREVGFGNADVGANLLLPGTGFIIRKGTNSSTVIWTNAPNW